MTPNRDADASAAGVVFIYTTAATADDAQAIAAHVVGAGLAACANIFSGMISLYEWEGEVRTDAEVAMLLKTRRALKDQAMAAVRAVHPYTTPAVVAFAAEAVDPAFAAWLEAATARPAAKR